MASTVAWPTRLPSLTRVPSMMAKLSAYYMAGKLKYRAHKLQGLESAIDGINLLFTGGNTGKLMVVL